MGKSSTPSPVDDLTYDVITVLQNKAQALQAYDKYIGDAQADDDGELEDLFVQMRKHDEEYVLALKEVLAHRLDEDLGYEDEEGDEEDIEAAEYDDEDAEEVEDVDAGTTTGNAQQPPPRRGESTQRQR